MQEVPGSNPRQVPYGSSILGLPKWELVVKNLPANAGDVRDMGSVPGLGKSPVFLPGEPHGQRSLGDCSP